MPIPIKYIYVASKLNSSKGKEGVRRREGECGVEEEVEAGMMIGVMRRRWCSVREGGLLPRVFYKTRG